MIDYLKQRDAALAQLNAVVDVVSVVLLLATIGGAALSLLRDCILTAPQQQALLAAGTFTT